MGGESTAFMPHYRDIADLESAYDEVVASIRLIVRLVEQKQLPIWSLQHGVVGAAWLRSALLDFWYEDGQDGRSTKTYIGLVAADAEVMAQLDEVNMAKAQFSHCIAQARKQANVAMSEIKAGLAARDPSILQLLGRTGLARLNLKQTWRQLPAAEAPLERIHLSWYTSGKSIRRINGAEAEDLLMRMDVEAPHIQQQIRLLAGIPRSEPLARVQTQAPVMRANLFFREPTSGGRSRRALNVPLPLFVPSPEGGLPDHNEPQVSPPLERTRKVRSDQRLEDDAFLPSIRAYRYR